MVGVVMRAVAFWHHGGPDVLQVVDTWPEPTAADDEVLIQVQACALNHLDVFTRRGMPDVKIDLPRVTGGDIAGVVTEVGRDVTACRAGDRVLVDPLITLPNGKPGALGENANGGLLERLAVSEQNVIPLPPHVSFEEASALPIAYGTAHRMLVTRGQIQPGETIVVLGASGGVGTACVQLAALVGATVIAVVSSQEKADRLADLGAKHVVVARGPEYSGSVWELTGKRGADIIVDYTGRVTWPATLRTVRSGGRILVCGATTGYEAITDLRYLWVREITVVGSDGWRRSDLDRLVSMVAAGLLTPPIDRVIGFEQVRQAHIDLEDRRVFGKVIVAPHV